jgi:hypothetical protein
MAGKSTATAPNPAAPASTAAALAAAAPPEQPKAPEQPKGGGRWICLEDCLLADGFHYKDEIVDAAECPPHFGAAPEAEA